MSRILFCAFVIALSGSNLAAQKIDDFRLWASENNEHSIKAALISVDLTSGKLLLKSEDGLKINLDCDQLSKIDRKYLEVVVSIQQSALQARRHNSFERQFMNRDTSVLPEVLALISAHPKGIYGKFFGAYLKVSTSLDKKDIADADRWLRETIDFGVEIDKFFPGHHSMTVASALNNRAVLAIRRGEYSKAASYLARSAKLTSAEILPTVEHNANILVSSGVETGPAGKKLGAALAKAKRGATDFNDEKHLLYSIAHNSFLVESGVLAKKEKVELSGAFIPDNGCLNCFGRGYRDCGNCVNGTYSVKRIVVVGKHLNGTPITAPKTFKTKCSKCNLQGNLPCPLCRGKGWHR